MDAVFWLGLFLGGLLGLLADVWKRPLDRLLDRRLERRVRGRADEISSAFEDDPHRLRDYLVEVILQTTLIGSLTGILAGIFFGIANGLSWSTLTSQGSWRLVLGALTVVGQAASVVGAIWIVRLAVEALTVARQPGVPRGGKP